MNAGNNSLSGNVAVALTLPLPPNVPVINPDHPTGYNISPDFVALGCGKNTQNVENNGPNIRYVLDNNKENVLTYRILGNVFAQAEIIKGLSLRIQYGIDAVLGQTFTYWNPTHCNGRGPGGLTTQRKLNTFRWNWQNTLSYNKTFADKHKLGLVVGSEYQKQDSHFTTARVVNLLNAIRNRAVINPALKFTVANFATANDLIRAILQECRIVFLAEGSRWSDFHRLANARPLAPTGIPAIIYNDFRFLWPTGSRNCQ